MCARQVHAVAEGREDAGVGGHVERADLVEREVLVVEVVDGGEVGRRVATIDTTHQSARKRVRQASCCMSVNRRGEKGMGEVRTR